MSDNNEPLYLVKHSELLKLTDGMSLPWDRADICTDIICRGNLMEMWDSQAVIGDSQKIFDIRKENNPYHNQIEGYELQWRSFCDGWGEGRMNMLGALYELSKR